MEGMGKVIPGGMLEMVWGMKGVMLGMVGGMFWLKAGDLHLYKRRMFQAYPCTRCA